MPPPPGMPPPPYVVSDSNQLLFFYSRVSDRLIFASRVWQRHATTSWNGFAWMNWEGGYVMRSKDQGLSWEKQPANLFGTPNPKLQPPTPAPSPPPPSENLGHDCNLQGAFYQSAALPITRCIAQCQADTHCHGFTWKHTDSSGAGVTVTANCTGQAGQPCCYFQSGVLSVGRNSLQRRDRGSRVTTAVPSLACV